jgi:hypothetical protein
MRTRGVTASRKWVGAAFACLLGRFGGVPREPLPLANRTMRGSLRSRLCLAALAAAHAAVFQPDAVAAPGGAAIEETGEPHGEAEQVAGGHKQQVAVESGVVQQPAVGQPRRT